ncbi:hypothetical protein E4U82_12280 [Lentibacillus salicampi]|uniref:Sodium/calcium exchanger membrane region domain-containing protein n=1 Tax=Lentibacillus salicampi TaxID=175306 RepID=A0A4Y9ADG4_9BACI|nr:hypothetical protein E4U82_12280 [Lentibacillus salicampi]
MITCSCRKGENQDVCIADVSPLTIVTFGTSSPEATVSIVAALEDNADVSKGNVIGSNMLNITVVVGLTAIMNPLKVKRETVKTAKETAVNAQTDGCSAPSIFRHTFQSDDQERLRQFRKTNHCKQAPQEIEVPSPDINDVS